jgi:hypothetical protein
MCSFIISIPFTWEIEGCHHKKPNQINREGLKKVAFNINLTGMVARGKNGLRNP